MELNQIVKKYLSSNGIKNEFFASYIGCDASRCSRWLKGEQKLNQEQLKRAHEFLTGRHIKTVEEVMKEQ